MNGNLSTNQFSSMSESKQAMPESTHFDGPAGPDPKSGTDFSQSKNVPLAKPGFGS